LNGVKLVGDFFAFDVHDVLGSDLENAGAARDRSGFLVAVCVLALVQADQPRGEKQDAALVVQ
jgi:hypothetical protein